MDGAAPIDPLEARFLEHREDLVSLRPRHARPAAPSSLGLLVFGLVLLVIMLLFVMVSR